LDLNGLKLNPNASGGERCYNNGIEILDLGFIKEGISVARKV
jgi:hypothetical protein